VSRRAIVVERDGERAVCEMGDGGAALLVPGGEEIALEPADVPAALLRAVGARPLPAPEGGPVRAAPGDLALAVATARRGDRPAPPLDAVLDGFAAHWRMTDGHAAVEVVETGAGGWAVVPGDSDVELRPVAADWVLAAVRALVAGP
jgi:hypothetical protein